MHNTIQYNGHLAGNHTLNWPINLDQHYYKTNLYLTVTSFLALTWRQGAHLKDSGDTTTDRTAFFHV